MLTNKQKDRAILAAKTFFEDEFNKRTVLINKFETNHHYPSIDVKDYTMFKVLCHTEWTYRREYTFTWLDTYKLNAMVRYICIRHNKVLYHTRNFIFTLEKDGTVIDREEQP